MAGSPELVETGMMVRATGIEPVQPKAEGF